jgi:hypothetical protein
MKYSEMDTSLFPDTPPTNETKRILQDLNLQAFPSAPYARVDDILVHAQFSTKC